MLQASSRAARIVTSHAQGRAERLTRPLCLGRSIVQHPIHTEHSSIRRGNFLRPLAVQAYQADVAVQDPAANRKFANFTVYKGKAALCLKAIKPTWEATTNGGSQCRAGVLLLEFAAAAAAQGTQAGYGQRSYDWANKQTLALSAVELGNLLATQPNAELPIFHDPGKGTATEGQTTKSLKIQPSPDQKGYMFNFQVKDASIPRGQFYASVPVTPGEMAVIKSIANFALPRLLGFDVLLEEQLTY